ncbi:MAG: 2-oxoglutarate dehydrogenase E1 component [Bacteroidota bacterium]
MSEKASFLSNGSPEFFDNQYQQFLADPESVSPEWRRFFEGYDLAQQTYGDAPAGNGQLASKEINVLNLINAYRTRGHLFTKTNPVRERRQYSPTLDIENFDLSAKDMDTVFQAGKDIGLGPAKLKDIINLLQETYCQAIGAEYMYLQNPETISWLQKRMEGERNRPTFSLEKKKRLLTNLNRAVMFEKFLGTKFVGQKRFSLEGAESLIPALDSVIEKGAELGLEEFVIGMAHRGRLNVLTNILQKEYDEVFSEFEGKGYEDSIFQGDVKYHLGFSADVETSSNKKVHLSLMPNPSHLEAVNPVVEGAARAKIDNKYQGDFQKLAPILIHGDAAIAGQGIVYEVIQMSELPGYKTGGTIHMVINNQIGFTTNYIDARSSTYCTDVAKITKSPVFHVNGDDVEALVYAIEMAVAFRQRFNRDVFIDLLCYRRHGHNEGDEPSFTQPALYKVIKKHPNPREIYFQKLLGSGEVEASMAKELEKSFKEELQSEFEESRATEKLTRAPFLKGTWDGIRRVSKDDFQQPAPVTGVEMKELETIIEKLHNIPADFKAHKKINKLFGDRLKMWKEDRLDWALGELLAYGTLLTEGIPVRLSGQDVRRGTFSHRHSVILDEKEQDFIPLNHLRDEQASFEAYNSLLSEYGVLGFEYGYSITNPNNMVIWEAQFGDFANGSQIMMDQYISSAETKWQRMSGLIQLLPHGFEGQGPEHSSARLERYLELCAETNMQILNCTTPANFFHALRGQFHRDFRIPMVFFTPKKLLRYPGCVSKLEDFGPDTRFQPLIDDSYPTASKVRRVLLCSGKIYYDLLEAQQAGKHKDVAIVRLEQLYPLPSWQLEEVMAKYPAKAEYVWVQEEPANMGAWTHMLRHFTEKKLTVIARPASPSPASGYAKIHNAQQTDLMKEAFAKVTKKAKVVS